jgi:hypothetical protein
MDGAADFSRIRQAKLDRFTIDRLNRDVKISAALECAAFRPEANSRDS